MVRRSPSTPGPALTRAPTGASTSAPICAFTRTHWPLAELRQADVEVGSSLKSPACAHKTSCSKIGTVVDCDKRVTLERRSPVGYGFAPEASLERDPCSVSEGQTSKSWKESGTSPA